MLVLKQYILILFVALAMLFRELKYELDELIRFKSLSLMESERYWRMIFAEVILVLLLGGGLGAILPLLGFIDSSIVNGIVIIIAIIGIVGGFVLFALNVRITTKRLKTLHKELIEQSARPIDSSLADSKPSYFSRFVIRFITPKYFYISLVICVGCLWGVLAGEINQWEKIATIFFAVLGAFIGLFYSIILLPNLTKVLDIRQCNQDCKKNAFKHCAFLCGFLLIGFSPIINFIYAYEYSVSFLYILYGGIGLVLLGLWQYSGIYMRIWLFIAAYNVLVYLIIALHMPYSLDFRYMAEEAKLTLTLLCFLPLLIWHIRQRAFVGLLA